MMGRLIQLSPQCDVAFEREHGVFRARGVCTYRGNVNDEGQAREVELL